MTSNKFETAQQIANQKGYIKKNLFEAKSTTILDDFRILSYRFRYVLFTSLNSSFPRTSQASIAIIKQYLQPNMTALEYGSGKSTTFIGRLVKKLITIEHNESWYKNVKLQLKRRNFSNVEYHLVKKGSMFTGSLVPDSQPTKFEKYDIDLNFETRPEFFNYYEYVLKYPDDHFDFILLDGRARVECLVNAIDKLKPGGLLVLDNSNRSRYQPALELLTNWPSITTTTGFFNTTLWFKPENSFHDANFEYKEQKNLL